MRTIFRTLQQLDVPTTNIRVLSTAQQRQHAEQNKHLSYK